MGDLSRTGGRETSVEAWQWIVIAAAALVVVLLVAWALRQRRRARVRERFGAEYDRAVEWHGDRRTAEHDLTDRLRRRERLDIRPLPEAARLRYLEQWRAVQTRFVDQPEATIADADMLLDQVMRDRGYPIDDINEKTDLVSVDHPQVIEDYRAARAVRERSARRLATTDELRNALLRYRSLFDELLTVDATGPARTTEETRR